MVSIFIISFTLLLSSSIILSDDYLENLSVNTGETATFICDLPEKYSSKQVSSHVSFIIFLLFDNKISMITSYSHLGNI
jgi:hypothetical protein